jgi:archaetidylinositol phosphate synthase
MLSQYKTHLNSKLTSFAKKLYWINPNVLTLLGLIPPVLFLVLMHSHNFYLAAVMLLLTSIDMLDGLVARANNKVTKFGGFLDSVLDRASDFFIIAGLYTASLARLEIIATLLLATFLISYTRLRAEAANSGTTTFNFGLMERGERIFFIFIIVLLQAIFPATTIHALPLSEFLIGALTLLCTITVIQRIIRAYKLL